MVKLSRDTIEKLADVLLVMEPPEDFAAHAEWEIVWNLAQDLRAEAGRNETVVAVALQPGSEMVISGNGYRMQVQVD
jgi:hypothetical protein